MNTFRENPNLGKIGLKYRAVYVKALLPCFVAGDITSPGKHTLQPP